jgi:hypothetical protein
LWQVDVGKNARSIEINIDHQRTRIAGGISAYKDTQEVAPAPPCAPQHQDILLPIAANPGMT